MTTPNIAYAKSLKALAEIFGTTKRIAPFPNPGTGIQFRANIAIFAKLAMRGGKYSASNMGNACDEAKLFAETFPTDESALALAAIAKIAEARA